MSRRTHLLATSIGIAAAMIAIPFAVMGLLVLYMVGVDWYNTANTPDITEKLKNKHSLNLRGLLGGDLICAFPEKAFGIPRLTAPGRPFHGYVVNRLYDSDDAATWSIAAIHRKEKRIIFHSISAKQIRARFDGVDPPCGSDLTIKITSTAAGRVATFENVTIDKLDGGLLQ